MHSWSLLAVFNLTIGPREGNTRSVNLSEQTLTEAPESRSAYVLEFKILTGIVELDSVVTGEMSSSLILITDF